MLSDDTDYSLVDDSDALSDYGAALVDASSSSSNATPEAMIQAATVTAQSALQNQQISIQQQAVSAQQQMAQQQAAQAQYNQWYQSNVSLQYADAEITAINQMNTYQEQLTNYNNDVLEQNSVAVQQSALEGLENSIRNSTAAKGNAIAQYSGGNLIANVGTSNDVGTEVMNNSMVSADSTYVGQINQVSQIQAQIAKNTFSQAMSTYDAQTQAYLVGLQTVNNITSPTNTTIPGQTPSINPQQPVNTSSLGAQATPGTAEVTPDASSDFSGYISSGDTNEMLLGG